MPHPIPDLPVLEGSIVRARPWTKAGVDAVVAASHDPNRITRFIEPRNDASIRTADRAGFSCDGLLRAWDTYADGEPRDMLAFGRIKEPTG